MGTRKTERKRAAATERGRSPSEVAAGAAAPDVGRWNSRRKVDIVLRILRGEALDGLSRELKVSAARLSQWRDEFLAAGRAGLMSRAPDHHDQEIRDLRAKVGELTMDIEVLQDLVDRVEGTVRPPSRRPR